MLSLTAFQAERENKPLKAYLIVKRHMFTQSYLFPHSGLEGHAFHWHAAPLLSKSRKQIFGSLWWIHIPKITLTFPRNFLTEVFLDRQFSALKNTGFRTVMMHHWGRKPDRKVVTVAHSLINMLGEEKMGHQRERNLKVHAHYHFLEQHMSLVLLSAHT